MLGPHEEHAMLRSDADIETFHSQQIGTLPDRYGVRITALEEGRMAMEMELRPWMMAPNGFLHAASVILLADTCAGYATLAHLPQGAKSFTTIELKSNFLGTAKSGSIRTEAVAEHMGRTTQVWSALVFNADGRKIALFRCTQMILW
jgi:1,4-dihydroxy-2-naphthoyl-CoA hydrolase